MALYVSTDSSKTGALREDSGRGSNQVGTQSGAGFPTSWSVAVIDLSHVENYECDTTNPIYIMINPGHSTYTFDIAYAAIVDDLDEVKELITEDTFLLYKDGWSNPTTHSTSQSQSASADYQLTASDICDAASADGYALGSVELKNDAGFEYARVYNNSTGTQNANWTYSYADAEGVSGQYLIFKYRTNVESGWLQFATSTNEVITDYFADKSQRSWYLMAKDEEWHTVIVDLGQSVSDDGVVRFTENGSDDLAARFIGFRPFYNTLSADAYMDFAYIKWAVTAKEAAEIVAAEINVDFGYYKGGLWNSLELPQ
jgi:hypothetical protein